MHYKTDTIHNMTHRIIRYIVWFILFVVTSASVPLPWSYASELSKMESKLKAAFIYNFAKFVDWPASVSNDTAGQPFVIGALGYDLLIDDLAAIEGKTIKGRKLIVRQLSGIKEMNSCQVVFISASEKDNINSILTAAKNKGILTVSDIETFVEKGGIIGFVRVENKIRFDINIKAAEESGLKIRSDLLLLARKIMN